jgi:hypothetical protein
METHKVKYDLEKFPFHELVKKHFKWHRNLKYLNEWLRDDVPLIKELKYDQSTEFHRKFYTIYNESTDFLDLYTRFLKEVVQPCYDEPLVYQAKPSFRIHLPNNIAVGEWHKDGDYNHQRSEINWWIPFTDAFDTNTIWCESEEDKGDFEAKEVKHGEALVFGGAYLTHGNKSNDTGFCRVSVDFRVIPHSEYRESQDCSSNMKIKFKIGEYYKLLES